MDRVHTRSVTVSECVTDTAVAQLAAGDFSLVVAPVVVTHSAPRPGVIDLHSTFLQTQPIW